MNKILRLLSMLLGIGAIAMFFLASVLSFNIGWIIGLVMLIVALASAFIAGNGDDNIGSYRMPRT